MPYLLQVIFPDHTPRSRARMEQMVKEIEDVMVEEYGGDDSPDWAVITIQTTGRRDDENDRVRYARELYRKENPRRSRGRPD